MRYANDTREPDSGIYVLAAAVIDCAVHDLTHRYGMDRHPVSDRDRAEARLWLDTTAREWMLVLGMDTRVIDRILEQP